MKLDVDRDLAADEVKREVERLLKRGKATDGGKVSVGVNQLERIFVLLDAATGHVPHELWSHIVLLLRDVSTVADAGQLARCRSDAVALLAEIAESPSPAMPEAARAEDFETRIKLQTGTVVLTNSLTRAEAAKSIAIIFDAMRSYESTIAALRASEDAAVRMLGMTGSTSTESEASDAAEG